jgi:hypothetical protein
MISPGRYGSVCRKWFGEIRYSQALLQIYRKQLPIQGLWLDHGQVNQAEILFIFCNLSVKNGILSVPKVMSA